MSDDNLGVRVVENDGRFPVYNPNEFEALNQIDEQVNDDY